MLFNSFEYLVFLPVCVATYYLLPQRIRWCFLLLASYSFYSFWNPKYLVLILASTVVDYAVGLALSATQRRRVRLWLLITSLTCNLGLLFTFKYYGFAVDVAQTMLGWTGIEIHPPELQFLLPVGISFYTFQTLSYTLDVYMRKRPAERHLGVFAVYVAFFPQLVAGPIERSYSLLPQFFEKHRIEYDLVVSGLRLILWGMFKKIVVADNLAIVVDRCFDNPVGPLTLIGVVFFAYQIYCDFSGYSDIAIGSARLMGFDLMTNFHRPYHADSFVDFWRRWHISLSTWFRDYVYIPLGGSRVPLWRWGVNIAAVFVLSGAWHGANMTFIVWGALHAFFYLSEAAIEGFQKRRGTFETSAGLPRGVRTFLVFGLTCFTWVFFRAESMSHAMRVIASTVDGWNRFTSLDNVSVALASIDLTMGNVVWGAIYIFVLELIEWNQTAGSAPRILNAGGWFIRWSAYAAMILIIWNLGATREISFIYFQF